MHIISSFSILSSFGEKLFSCQRSKKGRRRRKRRRTRRRKEKEYRKILLIWKYEKKKWRKKSWGFRDHCWISRVVNYALCRYALDPEAVCSIPAQIILLKNSEISVGLHVLDWLSKKENYVYDHNHIDSTFIQKCLKVHHIAKWKMTEKTTKANKTAEKRK